MKIRYLDGNRLYYAFLAGGQAVIRDQAYLNKINVFPVPDSDTGTNLASTMRSIAEGARASRSANVTLGSIADAALLGTLSHGTLLVVRIGHTTIDSVTRAMQSPGRSPARRAAALECLTWSLTAQVASRRLLRRSALKQRQQACLVKDREAAV